MADSISDDFAMANGIAAFHVISVLLRYLEVLGIPKSAVRDIMLAAEKNVTDAGQLKHHAAFPIAADLLQETRKRLEAMPAATH